MVRVTSWYVYVTPFLLSHILHVSSLPLPSTQHGSVVTDKKRCSSIFANLLKMHDTATDGSTFIREFMQVNAPRFTTLCASHPPKHSRSRQSDATNFTRR